jgi:hypothetical protein
MGIQKYEDQLRKQSEKDSKQEQERAEKHKRDNPAVWKKYWDQVNARLAKGRDSGKFNNG